MTNIESIKTVNGIVLVRIATGKGWHRTSIGPDEDIDKQMAAVNVHLGAMGFSAVDAAPVVAARPTKL